MVISSDKIEKYAPTVLGIWRLGPHNVGDTVCVTQGGVPCQRENVTRADFESENLNYY